MKWRKESDWPECDIRDEELILQISGKIGGAIYDHAVITDCYFESGCWFHNGLMLDKKDVEVEFWMQLPKPMKD